MNADNDSAIAKMEVRRSLVLGAPPTENETTLAVFGFLASYVAPIWVCDMQRVRRLAIVIAIGYFALFVVTELLLLSKLGKEWHLVTNAFCLCLAVVTVVVLIFLFFLRSLGNLQLNNRIEASQSAMELLETSKNITVWDDCDVYTPPQNQSKAVQNALILFPGALTSRWAYAELANAFAKDGILTIVINHEPLRMTGRVFGSTPDIIQSIIDRIGEQLHLTVDKWSIGGHSMGAATAIQIANEMPSSFHSIVLWGYNSPWDQLPAPINLDCLIIQADHDGFYFRTPQAKDSWLEGLKRYNTPRKRVWLHTIAGGNHGGFTSADRRQVFPKPDGPRAITLEQQQAEVLDATRKFITGKHQ